MRRRFGQGWFGEEAGEGAELVAKGGELVAMLGVLADRGTHVDGGRLRCDLWLRGGVDRLRKGVGSFFGFGLGFEDQAGTGDGVALVVEEALDAEGHLDVALAIEALAGTAFVWLELGELGLPEAQNVGRDIAEICHVADAEVELVRDHRRVGCDKLTDWMM